MKDLRRERTALELSDAGLRESFRRFEERERVEREKLQLQLEYEPVRGTGVIAV